jgi:uncharacterized protein YggT (Ycf19 family)
LLEVRQSAKGILKSPVNRRDECANKDRAFSSVTIGNLIIDLLQIYSLLIIIRAVLSWVQVDPRNQLVRFLRALTDPVLVPIQRIVPPIGGTIDISPIVAVIFVQPVARMVGMMFRVSW